MNRVIFSLAILATILMAACAGPSATTAEKEAKETVETAEDTLAAMTAIVDTTFSINVLVDTLPSPRKEMVTTLAGANITINYGSPAIKGRPLWGALVPYGEVWRTGANEATTIEVSQAISIEGQALAAGKYGLFTIPGANDWTLIINETWDQWGAYKYDESKDILRAKAIPQNSELMAERMDFKVEEDQIVLLWGNVMVPFTVAAVDAE